jgi:hypothetical protein
VSTESYMYKVVSLLREALDKHDKRLLHNAVLSLAEGVYSTIAERKLLHLESVLKAYGSMVGRVSRIIYEATVSLGLGEGYAAQLKSLALGQYLVGDNCIPVIFKSTVEIDGILYPKKSFTCLELDKAVSLALAGLVDFVASGVSL